MHASFSSKEKLSLRRELHGERLGKSQSVGTFTCNLSLRQMPMKHI
jgi:hypothetical protein